MELKITISVMFFALMITIVFSSKLHNKQDLRQVPQKGRKIFKNAMVAADNGICSIIGNTILKKGGNAIDAIIATAICIGVIDPQSSGLGGGHFLTYYEKATKSCTVFDARERAPEKAKNEMFKTKDVLIRGWLAIAVPGEIHGFWTAYNKFGGKVPWKDLWEPTIKLCRDGFPIPEPMAKHLDTEKKNIEGNAGFTDFKNPSGEIKKENDIIKFPKLAKFMEQLANAADPVKFFYKSETTKLMVQEIQKNGGIITENDFNNYTTKFGSERPAIYTTLKNSLKGCGPPPPSSAGLVLSILNVLDGFDLRQRDLDWPSTAARAFHKIIETIKFAYGNRANLGDMDFLPSARFLAQTVNYKSYAEFTRERISLSSSYPNETFYGSSTIRWDSGTAHMNAVDEDGNAASLTSTINNYFGSQTVSDVTGIIYNDEMDDSSFKDLSNFFNIQPTPANQMIRGKRPMSSMSPIIVFNEKSGDVKLVLGGSGGSKIISSVALVALRVLYFMQNIKDAIDAPRLHNQLVPFYTYYESTFSPDVLEILANHYNQSLDPNISPFSTAVIGIHRLKNGSLEGNCDFRKIGGYPAGY